MAAISVTCPKCDAVVKLASKPVKGKKVTCRKCEAMFVPSEDELDQDSGATAISTKARPKARPSRDEDDDEDEKPRSRKSRADEDDEDEDERPRRKGKSRSDDDDDDDDRPRKKKKEKAKSGGMGLMIGLGVGAFVLLLGLAGIGGGVVYMMRKQPAVAQPQPIAQAPQLQPIAQPPQPQPQPPPVVKPADPPVAKKEGNAPVVKEQPKIKPKTKPKIKPLPEPEPDPEPIPVAGPVDLDKNLLDKVSRATTFIRVDVGSQSASGSGFIVRSSGDTAYIITNYHVVAVQEAQPQPQGQPRKGIFNHPQIPNFAKKAQPPKAARPRITVVINSGTPEEQEVAADVVALDEEGDLAALRIVGARNLPDALDVNQEPPIAETQSVYIFGFPANRRKGPGNPAITVGKGTIAGLRRDANNELIDVHINGAINPGNSGGPVIDGQGRLVGVAVATVPGKQIGFAIPTGELLQMFKGRLANAIVLQLKLQGTRADLVGEVWVHDRKSSVRGRDVISVRLPDEPKGGKVPPDEYMVLAKLADPMLKVGAVNAYFMVGDKVPAAPEGKGWSRMPKATPIPLKIQDQIAIGVFKLPQGAVPDQFFAFQFSYVNADKQTVFTQPHLVRLTFPKNNLSATIHLTGIPDEPTRRYIEDTAQADFQVKLKVKSKTNDSILFELDPVPDPEAIKPQIKFGTVTSLQGRTFEVKAKKVTLPTMKPADVATALADLKSPNEKQRNDAITKFEKAYVASPDKQRDVAKALEPYILDKNGWIGKATLRALVVWGGPDNVPAVTPALDNWFTRGEAFDVLAKFNNPAAAEAVAKLLPDLGSRARVSAVLKKMGPSAEKVTIPFLKHQDIWVVKEACGILQEVGTPQCIPALTEVANSNNNFVNGTARDTLKIVQARKK